MSEFGFNLSNDFKSMERVLNSLQKDVIEKAKVRALNRTVDKIREHTVKYVLPKYIDRPTRWTLNSVMTRYASRKGVMEARVLFKDDRHVRRSGSAAAKYLSAMIEGQQRLPKGFEYRLRSLGVISKSQYAVPGANARLNRSGNIPAIHIREMLKDIEVSSKSRTESVKYFVLPKPPNKPIGIYSRSGKRLRQIVVFSDGAPQYEERLPFYKEANKMAKKLISEELREAARYYSMKSLK